MNEQLRPIESIMWRVGSDPTLRMTVGTLMFLDRSLRVADLEQRLVAAAARTPRLRQRPDDLLRARPWWIEDDDFDVGHHLRSVGVASGSTRAILDLVAMLDAMPFDPDHPPWDVTLIEGLDGGHAALHFRAHHVLTDGLGALRLTGALFDEVEWPRSLQAAPPEERAGVDASPNRERGRATVTVDLGTAIRPLRQRVDAARDFRLLDSTVRSLQRGLDLANSISRQLMVTGGPLSPLFGDTSMMSHFEIFSAERARTEARSLGGSRNDVLVTAAAIALGLYHGRMGKPCSELRLATPAVRGRAHEAGGNWFAPARVVVPTHATSSARLFGMVADRLAQARHEPALRVTEPVAWAISRLPKRMILPALHAQADAVDFSATALPGLRHPRHICGALIETMYPFGPRLGCPLNITAFGNNDRLDVGIALDPAAITDTNGFLSSMREAFEMLAPDAAASAAPERNAVAETIP